jgi:hypothetical protein
VGGRRWKWRRKLSAEALTVSAVIRSMDSPSGPSDGLDARRIVESCRL